MDGLTWIAIHGCFCLFSLARAWPQLLASCAGKKKQLQSLAHYKTATTFYKTELDQKLCADTATTIAFATATQTEALLLKWLTGAKTADLNDKVNKQLGRLQATESKEVCKSVHKVLIAASKGCVSDK